MKEKVLVVGYGRVGKTIAKVLQKEGKEVWVYDQALEKRKEIQQEKGLYVFDEKDIEKQDISFVIKSPGISPKHSLIKEAIKKGIKIIDEVEYTAERVKGMLIAITGTNGKSTTTALLGSILQRWGRSTFCGGNISPGKPFSYALLENLHYDYYVVEVSSFQLEGCIHFRPHIGILLNITQDHLNRHTFEEYVNLKLSLFKNQRKEDFAVVNKDDPIIKRKEYLIPSAKYWFSSKELTNGAYLRDGELWFREERILSSSELESVKIYNIHNILAATTSSKILGVDSEVIKEAIKNFKGLPHRMEFIREKDGIKFINNSMCTNPSSFYYSLNSFREKVIVIAGGAEKNLNIDLFLKGIKEKAKYVVLFGGNSEKLKKNLEEIDYYNFGIAESMEEAVRMSINYATKGDTIILSPGFASFDRYRNFEEKGNDFKFRVQKI